MVHLNQPQPNNMKHTNLIVVRTTEACDVTKRIPSISTQESLANRKRSFLANQTTTTTYVLTNQKLANDKISQSDNRIMIEHI